MEHDKKLSSAPNIVDRGKRGNLIPNKQTLQEISEEISQNEFDTKTILDVLPETRLIREILVSTMLSPNDAIGDDIRIDTTDRFKLLKESGKMIRIVRQYLEDNHKISDQIPEIIGDCLINTGSYPIAVLPETLIDQQINSDLVVGTESLKELFDNHGNLPPLGFLANVDEDKDEEPETLLAGLESYITDDGTNEYDPKNEEYGYEVVDNFDYLKLQDLNDKLRADRTLRMISKRARGTVQLMAGMEDYSETKEKENNSEEIVHSFISSKKYRERPVSKMALDENTPARREDAFGYAATLKLPSESVITISVPGDPSKHVMYIVMLDGTSSPVRGYRSPDSIGKLISGYGGEESELLRQLKEQTKTQGKEEKTKDIGTKARILEDIYRNNVMKDIEARVKSGVYGKDVTLQMNDDFLRNMLFNALERKKTRLLVLPAELVSYFAFDYNEYGIGKSLMEENRMLSIMRSISVFSNTMAASANSVPEKTVTIRVDPDTPDPEQFVEETLQRLIVKRRREFPFTTRPERIVDALNTSSTNVVIEGSDKLPNSSVSVSRSNKGATQVDTEWDNLLKDRFIQGFGLSPEQVDISTDVKYSASVVTSNTLSAKRTITRQKIFEPQLAEHIRRIIYFSPAILDHLREIINEIKTIPRELIRDEYNEEIKRPTKAHIKDYILNEFIKSITVTLPRPDTENIEKERDGYIKYMDFIDQALESYITEDMFDPEIVGENFGRRVRGFVASIRASIGRKFLSDNGLTPEIENYLITNKSDKLEALAAHDVAEHISKITNMLEIVDREGKKQRKKSERVIEKEQNEESEGGGDDNNESVSMDEFGSADDESTPSEETPETEEGGDEEPAAEGDEESTGGEGDGAAGEEPEA